MEQYKFLVGFLKQHRRVHLAIISAALTASAIVAVTAVVIGPVFELLFHDESKTTLTLSQIFDPRIQTLFQWLPFNLSGETTLSKARFFTLFPIIILTLAATKSLLVFSHAYALQRLGEKLANQLRSAIHHALTTRPVNAFSQLDSGLMLTLMGRDTDLIRSLYTRMTGTGVQELTNAFFCLSLMLYISPTLFLFIVVIGPPSALFIRKVGRRIRGYSRNALEHDSRLSGYVHRAMNGIETIKAYRGEEKEQRRFSAISDDLFRAMKSTNRFRSASAPVLEFMGMAVGAAVIWFSARLIDRGTLSTHAFITFFIALITVAQSSQKFAWILNVSREGSAALERFSEFVSESSSTPTHDLTPLPLPTAIEVLSFRHIQFAYHPQHPVIKDVSVQFKKGEVTAIIGDSGAGKSTLFNLLLRFYVPQSGQIMADNTDFTALPPRVARNYIASVSQEPFLFNDSIAANICYPETYTSTLDDSIQEALHNAHASDFVNNFADRHLHVVAENGKSLSQGQRQRLALARGLFRDRPILLLDEAASALDGVSEKAVALAINNAKKNKIVLMIAHRLESALRADRVIVFAGGHIIEDDTPKALINARGTFFKLIETSSLA